MTRCKQCDQPLVTPNDIMGGAKGCARNWSPEARYHCDANSIDWRARALAAEAERDDLRTREAYAQAFAGACREEADKVRHLNGDIIAALAIWVGPDDDLPIVVRRELARRSSDAARAERELIVAELQARAAENRAAQQGAAIERQAIVADEAGRRAAQLEHLAAFFQRGDHAKGGG